MLRDKVIDGTPCGPDTFHICVNGQCKPAGCDHVLNSTAELDTCGVCRGDNSTCQRITGSYNASVYGYTKVAKIPAGSSYIDIRQHGWLGSHNDSNYLGKTSLSKCMHTLCSAHRLSPIKFLSTDLMNVSPFINGTRLVLFKIYQLLREIAYYTCFTTNQN